MRPHLQNPILDGSQAADRILELADVAGDLLDGMLATEAAARAEFFDSIHQPPLPLSWA